MDPNGSLQVPSEFQILSGSSKFYQIFGRFQTERFSVMFDIILKYMTFLRGPVFGLSTKKAIRPFIRWKRLPLLSLRLVVAIVVPRFLLENQIFFLQSVRRRYIEGRSLFCLRALIVRINPSSSPSCFHSIIKVKVERKELPAAVLLLLLHSFSTLISCLIG